MQRGKEWSSIVVPIAIGVFIAFLVLSLCAGYSFSPMTWKAFGAWTGFGPYTKPTSEYERGKTLWDWMQLLIIPVVLGIGAAWFNNRREKSTRQLEDNRIKEDRLQSYLDRMTELILDNKMSDDGTKSEVHYIARARTLATLRGLDAERKGVILKFLCESRLVEVQPLKLVIADADFSGAILTYDDISVSVLEGANFQSATLNTRTLLTQSLEPEQFLKERICKIAALMAPILRGLILAE